MRNRKKKKTRCEGINNGKKDERKVLGYRSGGLGSIPGTTRK
jgi:hypothetical protein